MSGAPPLRIIGIDPGTRFVGYGVVDLVGAELRHVASGCIRAESPDVPERLAAIHTALVTQIRAHVPAGTLVEAAVETAFAGVNPRTAIAIGEGRGVAIAAAATAGIPVRGYEPALVKRAVAGSGRAGKEQVRAIVQTLLRLPSPPATDHESDALAIAVAHALRRRAPERREMSPSARAALGGVRKGLAPGVAAQLPGGRAGRRKRSRFGV